MIALPRTPSLRLDGHRALVTGASRGIGLGCAVALAEAGAHVVCASRGRKALDEAVAAINSAGFSAEALILDIDDVAASSAAIEASGPFRVFVSNAGTARHAPLTDTTTADFDAVVNVNLRGAYFATQAVARGMVATGQGGSIITISSQMGHIGGVDRTVYAATKHAIEGMTKSAAIELAQHRIRVNTICPTFVRTPPHGTDVCKPGAGRVDRIEDQARTSCRGRGHYGRRRFPGERCGGNGDRRFAACRRRLDRRMRY